MPETTFVDYYEVLESSPNAHSSTIDQLFVSLGKRYHPDVPGSGDKHKFAKIAEAYRVLRNSAERANYDARYANEKRPILPTAKEAPASESRTIEEDAADCQKLLALFYKKRRDDIRQPGLAVGGLQHLVDYPLTVLEFHLWYCSQKGWLKREEGGQLAITAAGIDIMDAAVTFSTPKVVNLPPSS